MSKQPLADFQEKFTKTLGVPLAMVMFFVSAFMVMMISIFVNINVNRYVKMMTTSTQNHLMSTALAAALFVSADELDLYHTVEDTKNSNYLGLKTRLARFAKDHNVLYVYYLRNTMKTTFSTLLITTLIPRL